MKKKSEVRKNCRGILIVGAFFVAALACVIVAIVINLTPKSESEVPDFGEEKNIGVSYGTEILEEYFSEGEHSAEDALNKFKQKMDECGDLTCKVYVGIGYMQLSFTVDQDIDKALGILLPLENEISELPQETVLDYYVALMGVLDRKGTNSGCCACNAKIERYDKIIDRLVAGDAITDILADEQN